MGYNKIRFINKFLGHMSTRASYDSDYAFEIRFNRELLWGYIEIPYFWASVYTFRAKSIKSLSNWKYCLLLLVLLVQVPLYLFPGTGVLQIFLWFSFVKVPFSALTGWKESEQSRVITLSFKVVPSLEVSTSYPKNSVTLGISKKWLL